MKVVIVAEDSEDREALASGLGHEGFRVDSTNSAAQALAIMEAEDVHAVVSDYQLTGRSGVWLLERVAKLHPEAFRVLITEDPRIDGHRLTRHGICHVCRRKPIDVVELSRFFNDMGVEVTQTFSPVRVPASGDPGGSSSSGSDD